MPGFVKNPYAYLQQSNIFVLTSTFEGFGNVIIEALACECVVISTDCPVGPREILAPNSQISSPISDIEFAEFGILTPLNSTTHLTYAMQYIIDNPLKWENKKFNGGIDNMVIESNAEYNTEIWNDKL